MENKYVLTIIHGSKEHWRRYEEAIIKLNQAGIEVVTGDLASHGELFDGKYHNFTFNEMLKSAVKLVDEAKEKYPDHKQIIMGHSMGSFIVKYIVYMNVRKFDGVILSGTNNVGRTLANIAMLTTSFSKNKVWAINENISYGMLDRATKKRGFGDGWLSVDKENEEAFEKDPLCGNDFSNGSLNAMYKFIKYNGLGKTLKNFETKNIPQLLIYGTQDPVTNFGKDIYSLVKKHNKYGINNHKVIGYEGCKHEILFDVKKEQVTSDIIDFIKNV